eukprot:scaffold36141_cov16-Tisochrysis_lutea.AAC.4
MPAHDCHLQDAPTLPNFVLLASAFGVRICLLDALQGTLRAPRYWQAWASLRRLLSSVLDPPPSYLPLTEVRCLPLGVCLNRRTGQQGHCWLVCLLSYPGPCNTDVKQSFFIAHGMTPPSSSAYQAWRPSVEEALALKRGSAAL